jgi:hypothetical protein
MDDRMVDYEGSQCEERSVFGLKHGCCGRYDCSCMVSLRLLPSG